MKTRMQHANMLMALAAVLGTGHPGTHAVIETSEYELELARNKRRQIQSGYRGLETDPDILANNEAVRAKRAAKEARRKAKAEARHGK